eukprot:7691316-Pyramimonas_sp.AAC.1
MPGVSQTCEAGGKTRLIHCALASERARQIMNFSGLDVSAPWGTHVGLQCVLRAAPQAFKCSSFEVAGCLGPPR